ncbi:unnamed protein product [Rotaria magnacalcarata]
MTASIQMYCGLKKLLVISLLFINIYSTDGLEWNYNDFGPDMWSETYPACAGKSQSPIIIKTACTTYRTFVPFRFSSDYNLTYNFTLLNNGHTMVSTYNSNGSTPFTLSGGGLNGTFQFLNFHVHWGENSKSGSEHQVNNVKYTGEIHLVHQNSETGQIAVLGIFMNSSQNSSDEIGNTANATIKEWVKFFTTAVELGKVNESTELSLNLATLMGNNLNNFWRYGGSLTTPPCTEDVVWTVFKVPIVVSEDEIDSFRKDIFSENDRSPQPLYNRIVYRNFLNETLSPIPDYNCCSDTSNNAGNKIILSKPIKYYLLYFPLLFFF